jgi:hypothetical protein
VACGEGAKRARAERRVVARAHRRSLARPETVRSRAEGPGSNVKGGAGWCADAVSVGHDPHGREEFPDRIRGRRALAHLPRTREPARTRPGMSRRHRRTPKCRRRGPCASDRPSPLRPPSSPPHPGNGRPRTTSHAGPVGPVESSSERHASAGPVCSGRSVSPREPLDPEARCGNRTLANPQLSLQP